MDAVRKLTADTHIKTCREVQKLKNSLRKKVPKKEDTLLRAKKVELRSLNTHLSSIEFSKLKLKPSHLETCH